MTTPARIGDERGSTIIELLVGMSMGVVVLAGLSLLIIGTLHGNARVDARVEATQDARLTVTNIIEELHSACISPQVAPVRETSSGTKLIFWHAATGETEKVQPIPVRSEIYYEGGTLYQTDKAKSGGTSPEWTFASTGTTRKLITNVAPVEGTTSIFNYFRYEKGAPATSALATPLSKTGAEETVLVTVDLEAEPRTHPIKDAGSSAVVSDSATLRLTPPSFNEGAAALPCQ
jgi:Tfp pilus assembly protein PilW